MRVLAVAAALYAGMACLPAATAAQPAPQPPAKPQPATPAKPQPATPAKPQPATPTPRPAAGASSAAPPIRGFVTFGAGAQVGSTDFSETHSEPLNAEQKTWTADYAVRTGLEIEAGAGWRVWRRLFAGATYSRFHDSRRAGVTGQIPHPFFFNQARSISGESAGLSHDENAVHISAWWIVPVSRRLEVGIFGGPSIIGVSRQLVKDVEYTETYPFDTAAFSAAPVESVSKTAAGVHAGIDVTWLLNRQIGIGGTVRYSHAAVDLSTPSGGSVSFDAGGLQAAVAVRIRILAKPPARTPARPAPPRTAPTGTVPRIQDPSVGAVTAVTTAIAPIFLRPDATRTPLRQLPTGTRVRVLEQTGDWLRIEFDDQQYGSRVAYIQKAFVRIN